MNTIGKLLLAIAQLVLYLFLFWLLASFTAGSYRGGTISLVIVILVFVIAIAVKLKIDRRKEKDASEE